VAATPAAAASAVAAAPREKVKITTDVVEATFDSQGGTLLRLELLKYSDANDHKQRVLIFDESATRQYFARTGLVTLQSGVSHVWVSIHPDLMENYGHSKDELLDFMRSMSYEATYLGTDHEEHWLFRPEPV